MRIAKREHSIDWAASLKGLAFVLLCIATMLVAMEFVVLVVRFLAG